MKRILLIHGRDQQDENEDQLKQHWIDSLWRGFKNADLDYPDDVVVDFPYYGKLLPQLIRDYQANLQKQFSRAKGAEISTDELQFEENFLTDLIKNVGLNKFDLFKEEQSDAIEKGSQNTAMILSLARKLDQGGWLGTIPVRLITNDVFKYLTRATISYQIHKLVFENCYPDTTVVIGHSLGSIIGYNILKHQDCPQNIKAYITLGSPLGMNSIKSKLQHPLKHPKSLSGNWSNFYDPKDIVALLPLDEHNFPISPPISNFGSVNNSSSNHHAIADYLSHPEVAKAVWEGLNK